MRMNDIFKWFNVIRKRYILSIVKYVRENNIMLRVVCDECILYKDYYNNYDFEWNFLVVWIIV